MKNENKRSAKFFCENCGAEVPQNAKMCIYCGRFFSSVRCPKCGETGPAAKFTNGCPSCGYAFGGSSTQDNSRESNSSGKKSRAAFSRMRTGNSLRKSMNSGISGQAKNYDESLPAWIYVVTFLVLGVMVFLFKYSFL